MSSFSGVLEQELYRYAGDTSTTYYKAVKGWQDASRMKNEVKCAPPDSPTSVVMGRLGLEYL